MLNEVGRNGSLHWFMLIIAQRPVLQAYSPYLLIYGRQPRLPIDIEYGVALLGSYMDCKSYADKLRHRLQWAYQAAQRCIDKETTHYKKYYDKNYKCAVLREGDLVSHQD